MSEVLTEALAARAGSTRIELIEAASSAVQAARKT